MWNHASGLVAAGLSYLRRDPLFPLRAALNAARLELTIPLDLVRFAIAQRPPGRGPERIELDPAPPGLSVRLTVDVFGTKLDVALRAEVDAVDAEAHALRLTARVRDLAISAPPGSPAARMIASLDLSRPASLLRMMPVRMDALVEAEGDRFVIDLLRLPALSRSALVRKILDVVEGAARIREVRTEGENLIVAFAVLPAQIPSALLKLRGRP